MNKFTQTCIKNKKHFWILVFLLIHVACGVSVDNADTPLSDEIYLPGDLELWDLCYIPDNLDYPETWLAFGQSNMRGQLQGDLKSDFTAPLLEVRQSDSENPEIVVEDWTEYDQAPSFSYVASYFGAAFSNNLNENIRVHAAAWDGTSLACWMEDGTCYQTYIEPLIAEGITPTGVIWWQGEANGLWPEGNYESDFKELISNLRQRFNNPVLRFVIVELQKRCKNWSSFDTYEAGPCLETKDWREIRLAQRTIADQDPFIEIVSASQYTNGELHPSYAYDDIGISLAESALGLSHPSCSD